MFVLFSKKLINAKISYLRYYIFYPKLNANIFNHNPSAQKRQKSISFIFENEILRCLQGNREW